MQLTKVRNDVVELFEKGASFARKATGTRKDVGRPLSASQILV
jgi:hypothetical protein